MDRCESILESLQTQLSQSFRIEPAGSGCLIETPFQYPDRRVMTVFVSELESGDIELSDDGYAHSYARVSGVGRDVMKRTITDLADRYGVDADHGEVVARATRSEVMHALLALVEASQAITDTVSRKRSGDSTGRLERQLERALVVHNRVYDRRKPVSIGSREITVDYNVLPTDQHEQLSLFPLSRKVSVTNAESMAFRIQKIHSAPKTPELSGRVLVVSDEAGVFENAARWRKVRDTLKDTGVDIVSITEQRVLEEWLTA